MTNIIYTALYDAIYAGIAKASDDAELLSDYADAATEAAMNACGPKPLVWDSPIGDIVAYRSGGYEILKFKITYELEHRAVSIGHFGTLEAAKAAAQSHADAAHWANTVIGSEVST